MDKNLALRNKYLGKISQTFTKLDHQINTLLQVDQVLLNQKGGNVTTRLRELNQTIDLTKAGIDGKFASAEGRITSAIFAKSQSLIGKLGRLAQALNAYIDESQEKVRQLASSVNTNLEEIETKSQAEIGIMQQQIDEINSQEFGVGEAGAGAGAGAGGALTGML